MSIFRKLLSRFGRHGWQPAAIALIALLSVFVISRSGPFVVADTSIYDWIVVHSGSDTPSKDIVIVDFDDASLAKIGKYPIPRDTLASVIRLIAAQKPRVIGLNMSLTEPGTPGEDQDLQQALTSADSAILGSQVYGIRDIPLLPLPTFCQPEDKNAASGYCAENKPGANGYGFLNMPLDSDGFIRQANLFYAGPPPVMSFPLMMATQYVSQPITPFGNDRARFNHHVLYYSDSNLKTFLIGSWAHDPAQRVSALSLTDGTAPTHALTDKLVLVGQSHRMANDFQTPMSRSTKGPLRMSGTEVQAAAIRTLLEGTAVRAASQWLLWLVVMVFCWVGSYLLLRSHTAVGGSLVVSLAVLVGVISLLLFWRARFYLDFFPTQAGLAVIAPLTLALQFLSERQISTEGEAQRKQLMTLFSSYVDPAVAQTIWDRRGELCLTGEERLATVLFTDIRNFTALSRGKSPTEVLRWLNQYVTAMDEVIRAHDGFLNKFIGDGLMIIFGLPLSQGAQADARRAMKASLDMLERVELLNGENATDPGTPQIRIGIGMHTGLLVAGSIGSANRQEYSVIGETVNLASRLESLNKNFGTELIVSEASYELLREEFSDFQRLGEAIIKGFEEPIPVYTIATKQAVTLPHQVQRIVVNVSPSHPHV